ncbi:hypothetical protein [Streptomyces sp. KLOTTS4A1]|uniref:hypothetical protein n=1 Tax=Streptomyces sp. KLOTTS4A1 TaxID=3390996 RepID=UPI0039F539E8
MSEIIPVEVRIGTPLTGVKFSVRRRLRSIKRSGRTGLLLVSEIREPVRSFTFKAGVVSVHERGNELCFGSRDSRRPKFVELEPGSHRLELRVTRMQAGRSTAASAETELNAGDILVIMCDPVQADVFYRRSPGGDSWTVGIV